MDTNLAGSKGGLGSSSSGQCGETGDERDHMGEERRTKQTLSIGLLWILALFSRDSAGPHHLGGPQQHIQRLDPGSPGFQRGSPSVRVQIWRALWGAEEQGKLGRNHID